MNPFPRRSLLRVFLCVASCVSAGACTRPPAAGGVASPGANGTAAAGAAEEGCADPAADSGTTAPSAEEGCPEPLPERPGGNRIDRPGQDRDVDGVEDLLDRCPDAPEDVDGADDDDGCPDP